MKKTTREVCPSYASIHMFLSERTVAQLAVKRERVLCHDSRVPPPRVKRQWIAIMLVYARIVGMCNYFENWRFDWNRAMDGPPAGLFKNTNGDSFCERKDFVRSTHDYFQTKSYNHFLPTIITCTKYMWTNSKAILKIFAFTDTAILR